MKQYRDKELLQRIAVVLKQLRDEKGLVQLEVIDESKVHVGRIETAKANPTVSTISLLCEYYQITMAEFFKRVDGIDNKKGRKK